MWYIKEIRNQYVRWRFQCDVIKVSKSWISKPLGIKIEIHGLELEFIHLDLCFENTNNPMWQKGSSRVTGGNWTIGVSSIQPKESSNCFSFRLLLEGVEEECGAISHSFEDFSWLQSFQVKVSASPVSRYRCKLN